MSYKAREHWLSLGGKGETVMPDTPYKFQFFSEYEKQARNADIVLYTPASYMGRAIARHTGGAWGFNFCHVEAAVRWSDVRRLMTCGYQEGLGGVARPMEKLVEQNPTRMHVFRVPNAEWNEAAAPMVRDVVSWGKGHEGVDKLRYEQRLDVAADQLRMCVAEHLAGDLGEEYAWSNIALSFLALLPLARFFLTHTYYRYLVRRNTLRMGSGICSQHIARSFRQCGLPLLNKPDALVTPNDLAMSTSLDYYCTLVPDIKE